MASGPEDLDSGLDDDELDDELDDEFEEDDDFDEWDDEEEDWDDEEDEPVAEGEAEVPVSEGWLRLYDHPHAFTTSFKMKLFVGYLGGSQADPDEDRETPGWWDFSDSEKPKQARSFWLRPEAAQRLMEKANADGITAEQALGWMLNRAYGRVRGS